MFIFEKQVAFKDNADGLLIKHEQVLPDEFFTELRDEKAESLHTPAGDFHHVASIPEVLADEWRAQGFDVFREPIAESLKRLRKHDLDAFIATNKRI